MAPSRRNRWRCAPPRIHDLWANTLDLHPGEPIQICFKADNATRVKASPGTLDKDNCIADHPTKTTTYKITALGGDRQIDTATVTVKVR